MDTLTRIPEEGRNSLAKTIGFDRKRTLQKVSYSNQKMSRKESLTRSPETKKNKVINQSQSNLAPNFYDPQEEVKESNKFGSITGLTD